MNSLSKYFSRSLVVALVIASTALTIATTALTPAQACTTFHAAQEYDKFMAKSYDWDQSQGYVYVNKRNVSKSALALTGQIPAGWISRYGSVTFNQMGREFPNGGMNEKKLAVEIMWLAQSVYPGRDNKPTVNELQWIQFALDNYASVSEMVEGIQSIRVANVAAPVHYMACDAYDLCATFEYIDGELTIHSQLEFPFQVLTNDTYADSIDELKSHVGFGGNKTIPRGMDSLSRFIRASAEVQDMVLDGGTSLDAMFAILESVNNPGHSVWQIVYDQADLKVNFRTVNHGETKQLELTNMDWSCLTPVKVMDMETHSSNAPSELVDYDAETNHWLIEKSINGLGEDVLPIDYRQPIIQALSHYPATTSCMEQAK